VAVEQFVLMAYSGQNSAMSVPCPEGASIADAGLLDLAERFHTLHETDRGFAFRNQQPQLRGVRLLARGVTPKPERLAMLGSEQSAPMGSRPVHFGTGFVDTPIVDGSVLGPGFTATGPCLIQEPFTVVAVWPGWQVSLQPHGSYVLTRL
jgi:N-methylhydantoinase A